MALENEQVRRERAKLYRVQQEVVALKHQLYTLGDEAARDQLVQAQRLVMTAERDLLQAESNVRRTAAIEESAQAEHTTAGVPPQDSVRRNGQMIAPSEQGIRRGMETTGLDVEIKPRMAYVPTSVYHLLEVEENPLIECLVKSNQVKARRVRVTAYIEEYSARNVETVEVSGNRGATSIKLLPTLFPERVNTLYEMTRATLNVLAEDLDTQKVEIHRTHRVWLLARNAATLEIRDPQTGQFQDLRHLLGAYVTPNEPSIQRFLQHVATTRGGTLAGRNDSASNQVAAIYETLQEKSEIVYVNATLAFNPTLGAIGQRVRLPHETLADCQANCLDGTLLFASLLEAIGLEPAIVLIPNHALLGWRTGHGDQDWRYLETTKLADKKSDFAAACEVGAMTVQIYQNLQDSSETVPGRFFRRLEIGELRSQHITPLA